MPRLTQPNVDRDMEELAHGFACLAIQPTASAELMKGVKSAATLQLHNIPAKQPKPAPPIAVDGKDDVMTKGSSSCGGTP